MIMSLKQKKLKIKITQQINVALHVKLGLNLFDFQRIVMIEK